MSAIVVPFGVSVETLAHRPLLPTVDELRPRSCPDCDQPAFAPGSPLGIVGHGTYTRQVLGVLELAGLGGPLVIWVRRYLCRGCRSTMSVLPDALYPGRWYSAATILASLFLLLVRGETSEEVRARFGVASESPGWRTLRRWRSQLLGPLWGWLARSLGFVERSQPGDPVDARRRLLRLLALHGVGPPDSLNDVERVAPALHRSARHGARGTTPTESPAVPL